MDNNLNQANTPLPKWRALLHKKTILILLGVFIIAEALWAGWVIYNVNKEPVLITTPASSAQPTLIQLQTDKLNVKVGEQFIVSVNVLSEKMTDGVDLVINFDPKVVSVVADKESEKPVTLSNLYSDYPVNILDKKEGRITVSGISSITSPVKPDG